MIATSGQARLGGEHKRPGDISHECRVYLAGQGDGLHPSCAGSAAGAGIDAAPSVRLFSADDEFEGADRGGWRADRDFELNVSYAIRE